MLPKFEATAPVKLPPFDDQKKLLLVTLIKKKWDFIVVSIDS
jgi:hypothetical protein